MKLKRVGGGRGEEEAKPKEKLDLARKKHQEDYKLMHEQAKNSILATERPRTS